jgi:kynurenine formamidase
MFMMRAQKNADYTLVLERVQKKGKRTTERFRQAHYPGWSLLVLKYLYEERKSTASEHETTDTDPGLATVKKDYRL